MGNYRLKYYDYEQNELKFEERHVDVPRICGHCHNSGIQIDIDGILMQETKDIADGIVFTACSFCGATSYHYLEKNYSIGGTYYTVRKTFPELTTINTEIPLTIQQTFPDFLKIYGQAQKAEDSEQDQLAGMGYRKAIEFLVTDYLIKYLPNNVTKDWLEDPKTPLNQKIEKLENSRIKDLGKAIAYLGNDETHYSRRHPEYDLDSLKAFIRAFLSDIENDIIYQEAKVLINKPKS